MLSKISEGDRVLLLYPPGLDFIAAFFGCLYSGVVAVPAYPPGSPRTLPRLLAILRDARPTALLTLSSSLPRLEALSRQAPELGEIRWLATDVIEKEQAESWAAPAIDADRLAFLQYTSGSTSAPRGVKITHAHLVHNEEIIRRAFGQSESSVVVGWLPLFHDMGLIGNVLQPLYVGAHCVLMSPQSFLRKPRRWLEAISRYRATTSGGPNFAYELLLDKVPVEEREGLDLSTWAVAFNGAEPVRSTTLQAFATAFEPYGFRREAFFPCYGLAEATLFVAGGLVDATPRVQDFDAMALERNQVVHGVSINARRLVSCGGVQGDQDLMIVDPDRLVRSVPGEIGEIWLRGPSVAAGYWRNPEGSAATFEGRLAGDAENGPFLRTGDLGFLEDGELFVTGRLKDLIILRGRNHYPQDLELTCEQAHEALPMGGAAAFSVDIEGGERLVLVQELIRSFRDRPEEVIRSIRQAVAENHEVQPWDVVLIRERTLPRTSSGKVRRFACRADYLAGSLREIARERMEPGDNQRSEESTEPATPEAIAALPTDERIRIVPQVTRRQVAGALGLAMADLTEDVPLTALGLDSLRAAELQNRLETHLGLSPPIDRLLECGGLAELDTMLSELSSTRSTRAEAPERHGTPSRGLASHGQAALIYLDRLQRLPGEIDAGDPGQRAYVIAGAARLRGSLDIELLKRCFELLVERHAALRTVFPESVGEPVQEVRPDLMPEFEITTSDRLEEIAFRPFDLARGPLLRVGVASLSEREHHLVLAVHHIVADLWSLGVMLREVGLLYSQNGAGEVLPPPPRTSFIEVVEQGRRELDGERGETLWNYWKGQLEGAPTLLDLPTDRPRPSVQTFYGDSYAFRLDAELTEHLHAVAAGASTTLFVVLLTGFQTLLRRWSAEDDFLVGAPWAGRGRPEHQHLVGYLTNPIVLRGRFEGTEGFRDLLVPQRRTMLDAIAHADYPFALLVERLAPEHDPSRSPLFQVLFSFQSLPPTAAEGLAGFGLLEEGVHTEFGEQSLESLPLAHRSAQFDLCLRMAEHEGALLGTVEFNCDLFDATTAERLAGQLEVLLRGALAQEERALDELPFLTAVEVRQLEAWNDTGRALSGGHRLQDGFAQITERFTERIALVFEGQALSYGHLRRLVLQLAEVLKDRGTGPETRVAVYLERSPELVVALWAVVEAGAAYVPLDPAYPKERLEYILEDSQAALLLTQPSLPELSAGSRSVQKLWVERQVAEFLPSKGSRTPPNIVAEQSAYVIYTSGSTGRPKGTVNRHIAIANRLEWMQAAFKIGEGDRVLQKTPAGFDVSVWEFFWPFRVGAQMVLARPDGHRDSLYLARLIEREKVTTVHFVPSMLESFVNEAASARCSVLRRIFASGEALSGDLAQRCLERLPDTELHNLYGPTEAAVDVTHWPCSRHDGRDVPIGRPVFNTRLHVVDPCFRRLGPGIPGELLLGGVQLARGYWEKPRLTAQSFVPDPWPDPDGIGGERLYRTGDLTRILAHGAVQFLGRIDHQVKIRGQRIELGEIEACLEQIASVRRAVVMVRMSVRAGPRLVAWVLPADRAPQGDELRRELARHLPEVMLPSSFVMLETWPLLPGGKVDRRALPDPQEFELEKAAYIAPRTMTERTLAVIWAEVLGVERVGIHNEFFALGGHSLLALRMATQVRESLGVELPMRDFLGEAATIERLAERIDEELLLASDGDDLGALLDELDGLSDEEVGLLLVEEDAAP